MEQQHAIEDVVRYRECFGRHPDLELRWHRACNTCMQQHDPFRIRCQRPENAPGRPQDADPQSPTTTPEGVHGIRKQLRGRGSATRAVEAGRGR